MDQIYGLDATLQERGGDAEVRGTSRRRYDLFFSVVGERLSLVRSVADVGSPRL